MQSPPPIRTFAPTLPTGIEQVLAHALAKKPSERYPSVSAFAEDFMQHMKETQPAISRTLAAPPPFSLPTQNRPLGASSQLGPIQQPVAFQQPQSGLVDRTTPAFSSADYASPTLLQNIPSSPPASSAPLHSPVQSQQMMVTPPPPPRLENLSGPVPSTQNMNHRTSRRTALGWIFGGITLLGLGIGAGIGISIYEKHPFSNQQQKTSVTPNTGQQQNTSSDIKYIFRGHNGEVTSLSWSPDGLQLASASQDYSVRLWDLATQQNTITYTGHTQGVLTVAWSHHSNLLASGGKDKTILVWDTVGNTTYQFPKQPGPVERIIWAPNDQRIIVDIHNSKMQEIILINHKAIEAGRVFGNYSLALSPNGHYLAVGAQIGDIVIYDMTNLSRTMLDKLIRLGPIRALAWSPDSTLLALADASKTVRILDITTKTIMYTLPTEEALNDLSWEPGNTGHLAIASSNGTVIVWNVNTDNHTIHRGHQGPVIAVAWGQQALASGSTDKTIIIWNM